MERQGDMQQSEVVSILRKENEAYKSENRLLRDRINQQSYEIEGLSKSKTTTQKQQLLESEVTHLR